MKNLDIKQLKCLTCKKEFNFNGYDFLADFALYLIEKLEDHLIKAKKVKPAY